MALRRIGTLMAGLALAWTAAPQEASLPPLRFGLDLVAATSLEAKLTAAEKLKLPVLVGEGLMAGNFLEIKLFQEVSPVSLGLGGELVFSPIAFLEFNLGAQIGSGWPLPGLANGLGFVTPAADGTGATSAETLSRLMYKAKAGGAFQFDLSALVGGDWTHVVFRTYHELYWRALAGVADGDSWQYENDAGQNRNGGNYYGNYFLGYRMPLFLDTIGFLLETDKRLFEAEGTAWGGELMRFNLGPLVNFKLSDWFSVAALAQWKSALNYQAGTQDRFYRDRLLDRADPLRLVWNRFALSLSLKF